MSSKAKPSIALTKLHESDVNKLFESVSDKLNIHKAQFFYPIYKKLLNDEPIDQENIKGLVFDSKFKCKEILSKVLESSDDEYEDCSDDCSDNGFDDVEDLNNNADSTQARDIKDVEDLETCDLDELLNNDMNPDANGDLDNHSHGESENSMMDQEIEEAINNTYSVIGIVERVNKSTGEKIAKEEKIFIKKSPLLEPLKVMQDIYVIPDKLENKDLQDTTVKNTQQKLDSYNNSSHVEALFLYLANKLVEVGKCPSFPYYYGCINGVDPNYHHNITDEYDSVCNTKWFKNRVKSDIDLLIIEDNDVEDLQEELNAQLYGANKCNFSNSNSDCYINSTMVSETDDVSDSDSDSDSNPFKDVSDDENSLDYDDIETDINKLTELQNDDLNHSSLDQSYNVINSANLTTVDPGSTSGEEVTTVTDHSDITTGDCGNTTEGGVHVNIPFNILDGGALDLETATDDVVNTEFIEDLHDSELEIDMLDENGITVVGDTQTGDAQAGDIVNINDDDLIETLSDFDKENVDLSDFEDDNKFKLYYIKCENMPVNLCLMEQMDKTLDGLLDDGYNMNDAEWFGVFFQVAFGLAVAQKYFNFVHNDLHSSNVMFKNTDIKYLYFDVNGVNYKIPTFGRITKIIDFARGTFKFGDRWIFSDQFKDDGEANGQYDYPVDGSLKNCEFKPNPSFDLVRLGTTVIERLCNNPNVTDFVERITLDDDGDSVCYNEDSFQLYIDIARRCHNAVPIEVITKSKEFNRFKIAQEKIQKGQYIYKY